MYPKGPFYAGSFDELLVFATLFFCLSLRETFSYSRFLLASLTGPLAFASQYGGMSFLVLVPGLSVYLIWRREGNRDRLTSLVHGQVRVLQAVFPFVFGSRAFSATLVVLLAGYTGINVSGALERWEDKWQTVSDIGLAVGDWQLKTQYDPDTRILTDHWAFYTPPEFRNVSTTTHAEWKGKSADEKERWKNHAKVVHLDRVLSADPVLRARDYRLVKRFEPVRRGDRLGSVQIYQAATRRPRSG